MAGFFFAVQSELSTRPSKPAQAPSLEPVRFQTSLACCGCPLVLPKCVRGADEATKAKPRQSYCNSNNSLLRLLEVAQFVLVDGTIGRTKRPAETQPTHRPPAWVQGVISWQCSNVWEGFSGQKEPIV